MPSDYFRHMPPGDAAYLREPRVKVTRARVPKKPRLSPEDPTLATILSVSDTAPATFATLLDENLSSDAETPCIPVPPVVDSSPLAAPTPPLYQLRTRGRPVMDITPSQTIGVTSDKWEGVRTFTLKDPKTLGKNQQGFKFVGEGDRQTVVVTKTLFAPAKVELTAEQKEAAKLARKNAPKPTLAERVAKTRARLAEMEAKLNQPELATA